MGLQLPPSVVLTITETEPNLHFLHGMVGASQASLGRIEAGFDVASFDRMVALLADAELIYVIGSKRAFPVTAYLSLTLSQQGVRNVLVDNVGSSALDVSDASEPAQTRRAPYRCASASMSQQAARMRPRHILLRKL